MRRIIFILTILLAGATLSAQTIGTANLYQKYRGQRGVVSLYLPGFVMKFAANIADLDAEEDALLRSVRSIRVLTIDDAERFPEANFVRESRIKPGQGGFQMLIEVSDDGEDVMILGKERKGKLKELLVVVGGDENVLVHIRGRLNADMLGSISNIAGLDDFDFTSQL
ncbi:DUF4252 domain-containing protein [Bacteroidota bacterium]